MIEIFSNIGRENLSLVLEAALSNTENKIHVEAIAKKDLEKVMIKKEFSEIDGENVIDKLNNLEEQKEKLKLEETQIIIRSTDNKIRVFKI
ncbi:hypothetical protein D3C87_80700 [compost metagenome]